jgi:four helix bundle protein
MNFYYHARGSLTETQSHLEYSKRVGYLSIEEATSLQYSLTELYNEINKIVVTLKNQLDGK